MTSPLPPRFAEMRKRHETGTESWMERGFIGYAERKRKVCYHCAQHVHTWPCDTSLALDALETALTFVRHVTYDTWASGDLLIEAKRVLDDIDKEPDSE